MCEDAPCCGCCGEQAEKFNNEWLEIREGERERRDASGWPGDGSGEDDLADFNANEANDYANGRNEDSHLDSAYEERCEMDCGE